MLHLKPGSVENKNTREELEVIRRELIQRLDRLPHVPGTAFQQGCADLRMPASVEGFFMILASYQISV